MDPESASPDSLTADTRWPGRGRATRHKSPASSPKQSAFIQQFRQLINGLPEQIALVDDQWTILAVNSAWTKTAAAYGYGALQPGTNYLDFCRDRSAEGHTPAGMVVDGICKMDAENGDHFRFIYHGRDRWEGHSFQLGIKRFEVAGHRLATITRNDVTELVQLRLLRESMSQSLLEGQAEERRRMAAEIHDSTMQLLASLGLAIGQLKRAQSEQDRPEIIADMEQLLAATESEIRSISYLAHPPLLKEIGLSPALQLLADGFARRTGLKVELHVQEDLKATWQAAEMALYRVVQEAFSNVHRHALATQISVGLFTRRSMTHVVVTDNGAGMPSQAARGVGLASMRERLVSLGGRFSIRSRRPGTTIIASLPLSPVIRAVGDLAVHG